MKVFVVALFLILYIGYAQIVNPVVKGENLPDPGAILYNGVYYVVTTEGSDKQKFPIHSSKNLQDWTLEGYAFVEGGLPSWANVNFWAPEIHIVNGKFRIVFAARESSSGLLCIGIGTADKITGPYKDVGAPVIRNTTVGSIDASVVTILNSVSYLIWKDDGNGNRPQIPTWIKAQRLNSDGTGVVGEVFYLIKNDLSWEADVVEGPWMTYRNGFYYLFYSGHGYCDASYAVGVARSRTPLGPFEKKGDPILKTNDAWAGPGHCSVVPGDGTDSWYMIYHSWVQGQVCGNNIRLMMVDPVYWDSNGWPYIKNSSPSDPYLPYPREKGWFYL